MESAFATAAITHFTAIILRPIIHACITSDQPGSAFAEDAGGRVIEWISGSLGEKIGKLLGREQTMQEKLNGIIKIVFDDLNEKHDCKFSEFPAYIEEKKPEIKTKDEMIQQIKIWGRNKSSLSRLDNNEIKEFVKEFYQEITSCLDQDDSLNAYFATLKTEEGVNTLLVEIEELKKQLANNPVVSDINPDSITLAEGNLKEQLATLKAESGNRIENTGEETSFKDIHQKKGTGSNVISNSGKGCTFEGIIQE